MNADPSSPDCAERVRAGQELASAPDLGRTSETLMALLLDQENTYVICATAEALLGRDDRVGLALVLRAAARAEDPEILDHLMSEFSGLAFRQTPEVVRDRCVALLDGADEELAQGVGWYLGHLRPRPRAWPGARPA